MKNIYEHMKKCKKDPIYFIENHVKIIHYPENTGAAMMASIGLIRLTDDQKKMIKSFLKNKDTELHFDRIVGKTTAEVAFLLWQDVFNQNQTRVIIARKQQNAIDILQLYRQLGNRLDGSFGWKVVKGGRTELELENGNRLFAIGEASIDRIRSMAISTLVLDEFEYMDTDKIKQSIPSQVYMKKLALSS